MCVLVLRKRCAAGKCRSATEFVFLWGKFCSYLCGRQQTLCIDIYHSECTCMKRYAQSSCIRPSNV